MKTRENQPTNYAPHLALIAVQVMFGCSAVIGKIALQAFPAFSIVGFRVGGGALAFGLLLSLKEKFRLDKPIHYLHFGLCSLFGVILNQILFFSGLALTTATNTSLLAVTIPIFALIVGAILKTDRLTSRKIAGVALASGGVIYLIDPAKASFTSGTTLGNILIILNCLSYAIYIVISKKLIVRYGALKSIAWIFLPATLVNVPIGAFSLQGVSFAEIETSAWLALAGVVIFPTIFAYYLNVWALTKVEPSIVAIYTYLQPLIGFLFAVFFLGEIFTTRVLIAAALIFAGLYLVTLRRKIETT